MTTAFNPIAIGTTPGDQTGDEPRAGFTKIKSDHGNFLSAIGRRATAPGTFGSTSSQDATAPTLALNDTTQNWVTNQFVGQTLTIISDPNTGAPNTGYSQTIASNTATRILLSAAINGSNNIAVGTKYQITPSAVNAGSDGFATGVGGTGPSTLVDANQSWTTNQWAGYFATFLAGAFAGQSVPIVSNTSTALTFSTALSSAIAPGTPYTIGSAPINLAGQVVYAWDVNPSNSGAQNVTNLNAHIAAAVSSGGAVIQIGAYSSPIPLASTVYLGTSATTGTGAADTPYNGVRIKGSGYTINENTGRANGGTTFQGTGGYPLFAYNATDNTVDYSNASNLGSSWLIGVGLSDLAMDTCTFGLKVGALSKAGLQFSQLNNLYVSNFSSGGFWLENYQYCDFAGLNAQAQTSACVGSNFTSSGAGAMMVFASSLGSLIDPGNSTFRRIFAQSAAATFTRGIVFMQRTSAGGTVGLVNDVNIYDIQSNLQGGPNGGVTAYSATATAGSGGSNTHLTLSSFGGGASLSSFAVDLPVFVADASSGLGMGQYQTYFVLSNNGTYITIGNQQGGSAVALTASGSDTIYCAGWPPIECVGYGNSSGNALLAFHFDGVDVEIVGTTSFLTQNASAMAIDLGTTPTGQATTGPASVLCMRNSSGVVTAAQPITYDFDSSSIVQVFLNGVQILTDTAAVPMQPSGTAPYGFLADRGHGSAGISLGGLTYYLRGAQLISSNGLNSQAFLMPQISVGQRAIIQTFNGSFGWGGQFAGAVVIKVAGNNTFTLPTLTTVAATNTYNSAASGNTTPPYTGAPTNSTAGAAFEIFNEGTGTSTIATASGQYFNANSNLTSIIMPPGSSVKLRAQTDGSTGFYVVTSMIGCYFNADPTVQYLSSGTTVTVGNGVTLLELDGPTSITVTFPTAYDNQRLQIFTSTAITSFAVSATGTTVKGTPTSMTANTGVAFVYKASNTTWYRLY